MNKIIIPAKELLQLLKASSLLTDCTYVWEEDNVNFMIWGDVYGVWGKVDESVFETYNVTEPFKTTFNVTLAEKMLRKETGAVTIEVVENYLHFKTEKQTVELPLIEDFIIKPRVEIIHHANWQQNTSELLTLANKAKDFSGSIVFELGDEKIFAHSKAKGKGGFSIELQGEWTQGFSCKISAHLLKNIVCLEKYSNVCEVKCGADLPFQATVKTASVDMLFIIAPQIDND